ncbi:MAG: SRPBCC family protein [Acidobacteriota bacterium]
MAPEYRFLSHWRVLGTVQEVADLMADARELPRWWPSVYLRAEELEAGDDRGVGKRVRVHTKGWLPYTLDWEFRVTDSRHPDGFSLDASGDLIGRGVWSFEQAGAWTRITYDWRVRADKMLLRILSPLFRPLLEFNHRWAMRQGEESLRLELARLRCASPAERAQIAPPPAPTDSSALLLAASGVALGAAALFLTRRFHRPRCGRNRRRWA